LGEGQGGWRLDVAGGCRRDSDDTAAERLREVLAGEWRQLHQPALSNRLRTAITRLIEIEPEDGPAEDAERPATRRRRPPINEPGLGKRVA
jgi:hypothetical protein